MGASGLGQLLVEEGLLQEFDRRTIRRTSGNQACAFAKGVIALGLFDEDQLAGFLTEFTKYDRVPKDFSDIVDLDTFSAVDPNLIMRLEVVPLMMEGRHLTVAIADPLDRTTIRQLEFFTGYKVRPMIATNQQIISTIQKLIPSFEPDITPLQKFLTNHVDAAAYHRRVRDMADPEIKFDTPQAAETVNFEAPRTDDNEFEELTLEDEDEFHLPAIGADDETELDLSGLDSIEGDDVEPQYSSEASLDDEPSLELAQEQEEEQQTEDEGADDQIDLGVDEEEQQAKDENGDEQIDLEASAAADDAATEDAGDATDLTNHLDELTGTEAEANADADLLGELNDQIEANPDRDSDPAQTNVDELDDILNAPVADLDSSAQTPITDDDIQANDELLEGPSEGETDQAEETDVAQLVAETMDVTEEETDETSAASQQDNVNDEAPEFETNAEEEDSEPALAAAAPTDNSEPATADDLDDILNDLDDQGGDELGAGANELGEDDLSADDLSASADELSASADELSADELSADELSADELSADELSADELSADELSADELSADELSADELSADDLGADDEHELGHNASPAEVEPAPTLDNLRAVADSAITDLNRAMVSLNMSTSKEDVCQVFCRAVGTSLPAGALLVDQGGAIEPVCSWAEHGEQLSWEGFALADPSVLTLAQLEPNTWTSQELQGLPLSDDQAYLVHLVSLRDFRLYMVGQPHDDLSESIRRHVSRMLKAVAKRL